MREMSWDRRCGQTDEPKQMSHKKKYPLFVLLVVGDILINSFAYYMI